MTTRTIYNQGDLTRLEKFLFTRSMPFTVTIEEGVKRSTAQNRLAFQWYMDVARQCADVTVEHVRAESKLRFGIPILRAENEAFREKYDSLIKPLTYEQKLELMSEPFDFAVTSIMTVGQMTAYLNAMRQYWAEQGFELTDPEGLLDAHTQEPAA